MRYYTSNESAISAVRPYGSDAVERFIAQRGATSIDTIEGPDSIGCYLVTFNNGDVLDVSNTESTPYMMLNSRVALKGWLNAAIANARKVARDSATIADESADLMALAIAEAIKPVSLCKSA